MSTMSVYKFTRTYVKDKNMMEGLFYLIKSSLINSRLSLATTRYVVVGFQFTDRPIFVDFKGEFKDQTSSLALLLSIRALILNTKLIERCAGDRLLFHDKETSKNPWILLASLIKNGYYSDDDFASIFDLLEDLHVHSKLDEQHVTRFKDSLKEPGYNNPIYKYIEKARQPNGTYKNIIANNAFVGDDDMVTFTVGQDVEYIGNTAFAYCSKLKEINIKGEQVLFGKFPIIECNALDRIVVPDGSEKYYQSKLPYYKDIIIGEVTQDPAKLQEVFRRVSTSYKFLWFLAILSFIKKGKTTIFLNKMTAKMICISWPLIMDEILIFGYTDSIRKYIFELNLLEDIDTATSMEEIERAIIKSEEAQKVLKPLLNNVPYRFLSPWIKFESIQDTITKSQDATFNTLYALLEDKIVISPSWLRYIRSHFEEVKEYAVSAFIEYLQKYNNALNKDTIRPLIIDSL